METPEGWPTDKMIWAGLASLNSDSAGINYDSVQSAFKAMLAAAPAPPAQEDEPVGFISEYGLRLIKEREDIGTTVSIFNRNTSAHTIPIYARPQSDELRKAAEEALDILKEEEEMCKGWVRDQNIKIQRILSAALEGK